MYVVVTVMCIADGLGIAAIVCYEFMLMLLCMLCMLLWLLLLYVVGVAVIVSAFARCCCMPEFMLLLLLYA